MGLGFGSRHTPSINRPELEREFRTLEGEVKILEGELNALPPGDPRADGIRSAITKKKGRMVEIRKILG